MSKEDRNLSDEFKKEIKENGGKKNVLGTLTAVIAIVLVFGTMGIASYELIYKPEKVQNTSAQEKIQSRPEEKTEQPVQTSTQTPVATTPTTTEPQFSEYTVAEGDVLGSIASQFDTTVAKLKELNSITDENSLQIGQKLKVPKK